MYVGGVATMGAKSEDGVGSIRIEEDKMSAERSLVDDKPLDTTYPCIEPMLSPSFPRHVSYRYSSLLSRV
jgi:hypothetical protein